MKTRGGMKNVKTKDKQINELMAEIKELKQQIKLFTEFKLFFEQICNKLNSHLTERELEKLKTFNIKSNKLFGRRLVKLNDEESEAIALRDSKIVESEDIENQTLNELKLKDKHLSNNISKDDNKCYKNSKPSDSEKLFKCPELECNKTFSNKWKVREHHKLSHLFPDLRPYVCDFIGCGAAYKRRADLRRHKLIHSTKNRFVCDWEGCHYMTNDRNNYCKHRRRHSGMSSISN